MADRLAADIDSASEPSRSASMNRPASATPRRILVIGGVFALVATVIASGVALATPASSGATSNVLADGVTANSVNFNTDPIKLRTKDSVEVFQVSQTAPSGWTSGWHQHTGAIFVNITAGSLTFYASDCTRTTVTAGHGYIESPYDPILARNEGSGVAAWITTQVIPVNASRRIDVPTARCGVS
jgi:hypothetical protein